MRAVLLALATVFATAAPTAADRFWLSYDGVGLGLVPLGGIEVDADVDTQRYAVTATLQSRGLLNLFERTHLVATSQGVPRLWRRSLAGDRAEPLEGTDGAQFPTWIPAGDAVTFFAGGELRQLRLADGTVSVLGAAAAPAGATWLSDGTLDG